MLNELARGIEGQPLEGRSDPDGGPSRLYKGVMDPAPPCSSRAKLQRGSRTLLYIGLGLLHPQKRSGL